MTTSLRFSFSATILSIVLFLFAPSSMAQQYKVGSPDAYALAMELRSGDGYRISMALEQFPYYEDVYEDHTLLTDIDPIVVDGLISALDNQLDYFFSEDIGEGQEYFFEAVLTPLTVFFTRIDHPDAIPLLLRASQFGGAAPLALAEHGPDIVPVIIDYMHSPERTLQEVQGAFYPLVSVVRLWRPLDDITHATLKQLSIDYMQGYEPEHLTDDPSAHTLKNRGSYLASALGDADLKEMVIDMSDQLGSLSKLDLKQWYEGPPAAVQDDQIDQND